MKNEASSKSDFIYSMCFISLGANIFVSKRVGHWAIGSVGEGSEQAIALLLIAMGSCGVYYYGHCHRRILIIRKKIFLQFITCILLSLITPVILRVSPLMGRTFTLFAIIFTVIQMAFANYIFNKIRDVEDDA